MNDKEKTTNFEEAFSRLEAILETMNNGKISLDESLKLYEEADKLIHLCSNKLHSAEKKIEVLIKNRSGELAVNADNPAQPQTQPFMPPPNGVNS